MADPLAEAYHLNSTIAKAALAGPGPHRPPVIGGVAAGECEAVAPQTSCADVDAIMVGTPSLFYRVIAACESGCDLPSGLYEGPP